MPPVTYRLFVQYIEPGIYQLQFRINELNQNFFLGEDTYANLKTLAGNIFKATFTWDDTNMCTQDFSNLATGGA